VTLVDIDGLRNGVRSEFEEFPKREKPANLHEYEPEPNKKRPMP